MKSCKSLDFKIFKRKKNAHKGNFGHVFVIAGSKTMSGAACLCARSVLLSGAGLVTVGIAKNQQSNVCRSLHEAMTVPLDQTKEGSISLKAFSQIKKASQKKDIIAIGPGLSKNESTYKLARKVISEIDLPMVIDADALNALRGHLNILKKRRSFTVVTPHPGEMGRLLGHKTAIIQKNRRTLAKTFAGMYNTITVLKGYQTLVVAPGGKVYVNKTGNPGMAKGGCGDVLTGIIAAFMAQTDNMFEAVKLAVYIHGKAADLAVKKTGQLSLLATDIINTIPEVLKKVAG